MAQPKYGADNAARLDRETLRRASWQSLLAEGAVQRLLVSRGDAAKLLGRRDTEPDKPFIDLWLALATPPPIGESLLGQRIYESELAKIGSEDDLVLIGATGLYSFKGLNGAAPICSTASKSFKATLRFRLKPADHTGRGVSGGGRTRIARDRLFRIARTSGFDATKPFRLDLDLGPDGSCVRARGGLAGLPNTRTVSGRIQPVARRGVAGPSYSPASAPGQPPLWQDIWWARNLRDRGAWSRCSPSRRHPDLPGSLPRTGASTTVCAPVIYC